eukprot:991253-Alexandrium_andersonii.AAC.1
MSDTWSLFAARVSDAAGSPPGGAGSGRPSGPSWPGPSAAREGRASSKRRARRRSRGCLHVRLRPVRQ